jgi:hypothetical protein
MKDLFLSKSVLVVVELLDSPTMSDFVSGVARICKSQVASELRGPWKSQVDFYLWVGCSTGEMGKT